MSGAGYGEAWKRMMEAIVDAGASDEFLAAARELAETAGRAVAKTYGDERVHALMCARQEFYYELVDAIQDARAASETQARVDDAERIRKELTGL